MGYVLSTKSNSSIYRSWLEYTRSKAARRDQGHCIILSLFLEIKVNILDNLTYLAFKKEYSFLINNI